eukprot:scaffold440085_cov35-Prasinocladus_malaysianus.AAC.1
MSDAHRNEWSQMKFEWNDWHAGYTYGLQLSSLCMSVILILDCETRRRPYFGVLRSRDIAQAMCRLTTKTTEGRDQGQQTFYDYLATIYNGADCLESQN